jgi:hypothetical protein
MRKAILLMAGLVASTMATSRAEAAEWLIPGSSCIVDSRDVEARNYQHFGSIGVEFKSGFSGDIVLACPNMRGGIVQVRKGTADDFKGLPRIRKGLPRIRA